MVQTEAVDGRRREVCAPSALGTSKSKGFVLMACAYDAGSDRRTAQAGIRRDPPKRIGAGESVYRISGAPAGSGDRVPVQTEAVDGRRDPGSGSRLAVPGWSSGRTTPDPCPPRESLLARSAGVDQWPGRPSPSLSRGRINASFRSGFRAALLFSGETLCAANLLQVYRPLVKALFHYAAALRRPGGRNFSTSGSTSSGPRITSSNSRPAIMP